MRQILTSDGTVPGWVEDVQRVWGCAEDTEDAASQGRVQCLPPLQVPSFTLSLGCISALQLPVCEMG